MQNESFYALTPHSVLDAVEEAGFDPLGVCSPMNSLENRVYRISLDQDKAVVAKFYRPGRWTKAQIEEEHRFLEELEEDELPVAAPLTLSSGSTLNQIGDIYYAIWELKGGHQKDEFTPEELMMMGRLLARIHNIGEEADFQDRPVFNSYRYLDEPLEYMTRHDLLDSMVKQRYSQAVAQLKELFLRESENMPMIRLHGDCHIGNILFRDEQPLFLDFDDSLTGPPIQDLWMLTGGREHWASSKTFLMEGYRTFRDFNDSWWNMMEILRGMRMVYYVGWLARRRDDPAFKPYFSDFGTRDFWERETMELERLLS